jgi:hypothetical protein
MDDLVHKKLLHVKGFVATSHQSIYAIAKLQNDSPFCAMGNQATTKIALSVAVH